MDDTSRRMNTNVTRARTATNGEQGIAPRGAEERGFAGDEPRDGVDERTRQIRDEIEDTRGEMSETIDAIQEKLTPRNIVANATERVKTATSERVREIAGSAGETAQQAVDYTRDTAARVVGTARQNPIPLALIGLGAAWWLTSRSGSASPSFDRYSDEHDYGDGYGLARGQTSRTGEAVDAAESVRRVVTRGTDQLQRAIVQNPLLVGAGAMMLGAAFGLAIPETEAENEWMGEARDSVVDRARGLARDATDQVQAAASTVADNVIKSAEKLEP
jgi:hypothetical protein